MSVDYRICFKQKQQVFNWELLEKTFEQYNLKVKVGETFLIFDAKIEDDDKITFRRTDKELMSWTDFKTTSLQNWDFLPSLFFNNGNITFKIGFIKISSDIFIILEIPRSRLERFQYNQIDSKDIQDNIGEYEKYYNSGILFFLNVLYKSFYAESMVLMADAYASDATDFYQNQCEELLFEEEYFNLAIGDFDPGLANQLKRYGGDPVIIDNLNIYPFNFLKEV